MFIVIAEFSSMGYTDCVPMMLPSFMCMHSSTVFLLSLQSSDGGVMMILAPIVILSGLAGSLTARKMLSYAWLLFYMIHLCIYDG